jgi:hypothetical protein
VIEGLELLEAYSAANINQVVHRRSNSGASVTPAHEASRKTKAAASLHLEQGGVAADTGPRNQSIDGLHLLTIRSADVMVSRWRSHRPLQPITPKD